MLRSIIVSSFLVTGVCQVSVLAYDCPAGMILCDPFNNYCNPPGGGRPSGTGDPGPADCPDNTSRDNTQLQSIWFRTSTNEATGAPCGEQMILDPAAPSTTPPSSMSTWGDPYSANGGGYQVLSSGPFAVRLPGRAAENMLLGQSTFKDWAAPNSLDLKRLIGNEFNLPPRPVVGTDQHPLVLSFFVSSKAGPPGLAGRIWYTNGYVELAYGDETRMNRANTDFGLVADTDHGQPLCCSPTITVGPYAVMCANGILDDPSVPLPSNCPLPSSAPVHNAVAIGVLSMVDNNPCHCLSAHGGSIYHPVLYDGKLWYQLKSNSPMLSTGTITYLDGTPAAAHAELDTPGSFTLYGGRSKATSFSHKDSNWITLTIKTNTFKIDMTSRELGNDGVEYLIKSSMDGIPRQYLGPFDRIRAGTGPGCELKDGNSWDTCATADPVPCTKIKYCRTGDRTCIDTNALEALYVDYDDLSLAGGEVFDLFGACCHPNATCTQELESNCPLPATFNGPNTQCATTSCCAHGSFIWADADADHDVDVDDFGKFQLCFTGEGGPMPADLKCQCFNRIGPDNDVDGGDYLEFVKCSTGANIPYNVSNLPPGCTP